MRDASRAARALGFLLGFAVPALLRASQNPSAAAPAPCTAPEYRQFDFWSGRWTVTNPAGKKAGTNVIERILGGCVLRENWTGADGSTGTSLNVYDAPARKWHQTWVDGAGGLLLLDGEFRDGKMVLEGTRPSRKGGVVQNRITWQSIGGDPDRVRQLWEASTDGGKTWKTVFDGTYARDRAAAQ
jgi:hypothetical protein